MKVICEIHGCRKHHVNRHTDYILENSDLLQCATLVYLMNSQWTSSKGMGGKGYPPNLQTMLANFLSLNPKSVEKWP